MGEEYKCIKCGNTLKVAFHEIAKLDEEFVTVWCPECDYPISTFRNKNVGTEEEFTKWMFEELNKITRRKIEEEGGEQAEGICINCMGKLTVKMKETVKVFLSGRTRRLPVMYVYCPNCVLMTECCWTGTPIPTEGRREACARFNRTMRSMIESQEEWIKTYPKAGGDWDKMEEI